MQPLVFAQILNVLQLHPIDMLRQIEWWIAAWVGLFIWFNIFHRIGQYFVFDVGYRVKQRFIEERFRSATALSLKWHSDHHSGEVINRINIAADALLLFCDNQYEYVQYFMQFWGPIVALAAFSQIISLTTFVGAIITVLVIKFFDYKLAVLYNVMNDLQHRVAAALYDYIGNIKTVITLRLGSQAEAEIHQRTERGYRPYMRAEGIMNSTKWAIVTSCILALEAGVILIYIVRRVRRDQPVLAGDVTALYQYLQQITGTLDAIAEKYQTVVQWHIAYEAAAIIPPVVDEQNLVQGDHTWQQVDLIGLWFQHAETLTLDDLSLSFKSGEKIAFVGESGSGKSSLMGCCAGCMSRSRSTSR